MGMYILIIARGYPTDKYKMNGIFEFDQAKALVQAGCKVVYAAVDIRSLRRWRKWGIEYHQIDGVNVYAINIPVGRLPNLLKQKFRSFGLNILYKKVAKEHGRPDILHAHFFDVANSVIPLKEKLEIPLVITEHSSKINNKNMKKWVKDTAYKAYINAKKVIAVSPTFVKSIKSGFNISAQYIPNIVDTSLFNYRAYSKDKCFHIVSTGRLVSSKRMDLLIEAFYVVFSDNLNIILTIFGEGPERVNLEKKISEYKLQGRVVLKGLSSRETISEVLSNADLFVLPSETETFGVAYIEALASGVPVIATKCGGPETFVNKNNGKLINVDDRSALIEAMTYMYYNIDNYDRKKIAEEIKRNFSPQRIAQELIKEYQKVCNAMKKKL